MKTAITAIRRVVFSFAGAAIAVLCLAGTGQAAVPRAFVSVTGNDTNPCSATQPCRSLNQALTAVEAGGEIVVKDSGGYSTGFTITQSVTIDAAGFNASVISTSGADPCTISAGPSDRVVLRGISFHGASIASNGITVNQVGSLYVEHCSISDLACDGIAMLNGGTLVVTDSDIRLCTHRGINGGSSSATAFNLVAHDSRFAQCQLDGVRLNSAGTGAVTAMLSNCTASLCGSSGIQAVAGTANVEVTLTNCRFFANHDGIIANGVSTPTAIVRMANCVVTQNVNGIQAQGANGSVIGTSPGGNLIAGNTSNGTTTSTATLQ
jgi:hypothetical protein